MSSADAKKFLTVAEQQIHNKLLDTVRAAPRCVPREQDFEIDDVKTIIETNLDSDSYGNDISSVFEVMTISTQDLTRMAELSKDVYALQVRVECGVVSACATKKIFDEQKYNVAVENYTDLQAKKKVAEAELNNWNTIINQRKKEVATPELPTDVAELQEMVLRLMAKTQ